MIQNGTPQMVSISVQEQFRSNMESKALSLSELSRLIGKSRNYLINIFSKNKLPNVYDFYRICEVLDIEYDYILNYIGDIYVPKNSTESMNEYMINRYNEFTSSSWYEDFLKYKNKPRYEIILDKVYDTCPIIDNAMKDDGILRGSTVLYEKGGSYDVEGQIYCLTINDSQKQVRELYKCPNGYMVCTASSNTKSKARFVQESDLKVYGKVLYAINALNKDN